MASRKDFVQRSRKQSSASPNRPAAAKPRAKITPPPKRKPWAMALFSLVALAGLVFVLNQLLNVDSIHTPGNTSSSKPTNNSINSNENSLLQVKLDAAMETIERLEADKADWKQQAQSLARLMPPEGAGEGPRRSLWSRIKGG